MILGHGITFYCLWILSENAQKTQEEVVAYKLKDTVLCFDKNE